LIPSLHPVLLVVMIAIFLLVLGQVRPSPPGPPSDRTERWLTRLRRWLRGRKRVS
jgi:hypothetical protein